MNAAKRELEQMLKRAEAKGEKAAKKAAKEEGVRKGIVRGILIVLKARGIRVTPSLRQHIVSCTDIRQLNIWIDRAAVANSADELFTTS